MDMTEPTPFGDLDAYLALARVSGLAVSPDGTRVVTTVAELNDKRTEFVSAVWEVDPTGSRPARRLTRGAKGESSPVFTAGGDVLFVASRPNEDDDKAPAALWRLPAAGGEAFEALALPGGVETVRTASDADLVVVSGPMMPSARSIDDDRRVRDLRKDTKVNAILHTGLPDSALGQGSRARRASSVRHCSRRRRTAEPHRVAGKCVVGRGLRRQSRRPLRGHQLAAAGRRRFQARRAGAHRHRKW